jgi:LuxR family transcriptional regulator
MVADYVLEVANATDLEKLWDRHVEEMATYGIDRIMYGSTRFRTSKSMGDFEDFLILSNHDRAYTDLFFGKQYYLDAPMVNWSLENYGPVSWSLIHDLYTSGKMPKAQREVYEFNLEHGLRVGYSISFIPTSQRQGAGMGLVAKDTGLDQNDLDALWKEHGQDIVAKCQVLHLKILTLPYSRLQRALTQRQREVLEWVGDGKTIQDISVLMDLKPATVEKHLRLAREALNVETTAQAILKASFQNQIFVLEMPSDAK